MPKKTPKPDTCVCDCDECVVGPCGGSCEECGDCGCECSAGIGSPGCGCNCKTCQKDSCCKVNGCIDCGTCSCRCGEDDMDDEEEEEQSKMSPRTKKIVGGAKRVVAAAALRTGASQAVKKSKAAMAAMLASKIDADDKTLRKKILKHLDTAEGEAMLAALLSVFTIPASVFDEDGEPMNGMALLGAELQVAAVAKVSDKWIDQITEPMMLIATSLFGKEVASIASNVRVAADAVEGAAKPKAQEKDEEEGEKTASKKLVKS